MFVSPVTDLVDFVGLASVCQYLSCTREPQSGCSSQDELSEGAESHGHFPRPAGNTLAITAQDAACPVCCKGTLLSPVQLGVS